MSPLELLHKVQKEDSELAFRQLFDQQYDRMFRMAYFFLQRDEWAEEVALDVLSDLWNNRHRMALPEDFDKYTIVMVRNAAYNLWKREQRFAHGTDEEVDQAGEQAPGVDQQVENEELFLVYERALEALPERCREVWQRVKEEGQSYQEVADRMGISTKTVDAQMQKAIKHLRQEVGAYLAQDEKARTKKMPPFIIFLL